MWNITLYPGFTLLRLIFVIIIVFVGYIIAKSITIFLRRSLKDNLKPNELRMILKVVNIIVAIFVISLIIPIFGVNLGLSLLVAGGVIGLVLGFACQSIITNFISGLFLAVERPIKLGNVVSIDGKDGTVEDIKIMSTIIRGYDGYIYRIPNETVFTHSITNFSTTSVRRFEYTIGIRYSDDANDAIEIINDLIKEHEYILINPAHQAFVDNLGDNSVNIILRLWAPESIWYNVKMEFLNKIKTTLESNGIEMPFPQRTVWYGDKTDSDKLGIAGN